VPLSKLRPGERASVPLTMALAASPPSPAGDYVVGLLVRAPHDHTVSRCEELVLAVPSIDDVVLTVEPVQLNGGALQRFSVTVHNRGNAPTRVHLSGRDQEGRAAFVFNPPWLDVEPQGRGASEGIVRAATPWTGQPKLRELTITGRVDSLTGGPPVEVTASATFVQRAKLAPAALRSARGLVTMATGVATVLGAALLVRGQTQAAAPSPAATSSATTSSTPTTTTPPTTTPPTTTPPTTTPPTTTPPTTTPPTTTPPTTTPPTTVSTAAPVTLAQTPGLTPQTGEQPVADYLFRAEGISSIAARAGSTDACAHAQGVAVFDAGQPDGYVHSSLDESHPTTCTDAPLEIIFSPQVAGVQLFLPRQASGGDYQLRIDYASSAVASPLELNTAVLPAGTPIPPLTVQPTSNLIQDVVLIRVVDSASTPTGAPALIVGVSSIAITPPGS
jgi:hypothetical protein